MIRLRIRPGVGCASLVGTRRPGRGEEFRAVARRSVASAAWRQRVCGVLLRSWPPAGGSAAAVAPAWRVAEIRSPGFEPLGRLVAQRPPRPKAMGDEHGRPQPVRLCDCEEPSASAGTPVQRPARACPVGNAAGSGARFPPLSILRLREPRRPARVLRRKGQRAIDLLLPRPLRGPLFCSTRPSLASPHSTLNFGLATSRNPGSPDPSDKSRRRRPSRRRERNGKRTSGECRRRARTPCGSSGRSSRERSGPSHGR